MTKPRPFQFDDLARIDDFDGRCLLAWEQGLGKTPECLWWFAANRSVRPAVIVCPAYLKYQWQREAATHINTQAEILEGTKVPRIGMGGGPPLSIVNYEILHHWLPYLKSRQPQLIIVDEGQYICNRKARRTRAVCELSNRVPHIIVATGTPLMNRPSEIFSIAHLIDPDEFPYFRPFADKYCQPRQTPWGMKYDGAENLEHLHKRLLKSQMIRRRKADVLKDLPPKERHVVILPLSKESMREYNKADTDFMNWVATLKGVNLTKVKKGEKLAKLTYMLSLVGRLKTSPVLDWVKGHLGNTEDKLVLFAVHIDACQTYYDAWKGQSVLVNGKVSTKNRDLAKEQFNSDKNCRLFVGNIQAAGTGLSLKAPDLAFAEFAWTPGAHAQAAARIHGINRGVAGRASREWWLVAAGTLEEDLCELLQTKQGNIDAVLDGGKTEDSLNVMDLLLERLSAKNREKLR